MGVHMSHISDFTQSDKEIITALILYDNPGVVLPVNLVDYENPTPMTGNYRNTDLTVIPKPDSGFDGQTNVFYDRLDITEFAINANGLEDIVIPIESHTRLSHVIPYINALLGISLTDRDYTDSDLPQFTSNIPNEEKPITIEIRPSSLIYIGQLTIKIRANIIMLNEVIAITYLLGLNLPEV